MIAAMKKALEALGICESMLPEYHQWLSDAQYELRAAVDAAERQEHCPAPEMMGEHACKNKSQCWEPCGDLGHSEAHVRVAKKVEPALLLDGMTSLQYVSNELYKFQEATGCDTADELPTPQPTERQEPKCHATETLCSTCNNDFRKCVRFHPPQPAPDGWKIVPIVPTEEMINAGMWEDGSHTAKAVWNAMVKAAPKKE